MFLGVPPTPSFTTLIANNLPEGKGGRLPGRGAHHEWAWVPGFAWARGSAFQPQAPGALQIYSQHGALRELQSTHVWGLCGGRRQNHPGAPQNCTFRGPSQGGPGICNCTKLPGDLLAAHFSFGDLLKPNPSPGPFSDEKIKAQGGEAWAPPTELDGQLFTWPLHTGPSALSPEAVEQHSGWQLPEPGGPKNSLSCSFPCRFLSWGSCWPASRDSATIAVRCDLNDSRPGLSFQEGTLPPRRGGWLGPFAQGPGNKESLLSTPTGAMI